jgi:YD repeat-containing protein
VVGFGFFSGLLVEAVNPDITLMLPLGMADTYSYDLVGNRISKTDFNGLTLAYGYDALDRLIGKHDPLVPVLEDPNAVSFTYTATGRRETMTDASGITFYSYDTRDRLLTKDTPQGMLNYGYDAAGNIVSTQSTNENGLSVEYAYDAVDRLESDLDHLCICENRLLIGSEPLLANHHSPAGVCVV